MDYARRALRTCQIIDGYEVNRSKSGLQKPEQPSDIGNALVIDIECVGVLE